MILSYELVDGKALIHAKVNDSAPTFAYLFRNSIHGNWVAEFQYRVSHELAMQVLYKLEELRRQDGVYS